MNLGAGSKGLGPLIERDSLIGRMLEEDQTRYLALYEFFRACDEKNKRYRGTETFVDHLVKVHQFIHKKNYYDIFRGFVCGIEFGRGFVIVNTKRLKHLMCRSKSCVNGGLQKLGYQMVRKKQDVTGFLTSILPGIDSNLCNSRQWCVRKRTIVSPICFLSFLPCDISDKYGFPPPPDTENEEEVSVEKNDDVIPLWDIKCLLNNHTSNITEKEPCSVTL